MFTSITDRHNHWFSEDYTHDGYGWPYDMVATLNGEAYQVQVHPDANEAAVILPDGSEEDLSVRRE
jgi:hypothetical protein